MDASHISCFLAFNVTCIAILKCSECVPLIFFCPKILKVPEVPEFVPEEMKPIPQEEKVAPIKGTKERTRFNYPLDKCFCQYGTIL